MSNVQITAAVLRDRAGRYEIEDVTLADPGPGQIVVRIVGVGHCHTDLLVRAAHFHQRTASGGWARGIRGCGDHRRQHRRHSGRRSCCAVLRFVPSVCQLPIRSPCLLWQFVRRDLVMPAPVFPP